MSFIVFFVNNSSYFFLFSVWFNLFCKIWQIIQIVFAFHFWVVVSDYVLFFLLPVELFSFKFSSFLDFLTFILESIGGLLIDWHDVIHVILSLCLGMIIDSEWPAWFKEWRICFWMEVIWNCFSFKSKADHILDIFLTLLMIIFISLWSHSIKQWWGASVLEGIGWA